MYYNYTAMSRHEKREKWCNYTRKGTVWAERETMACRYIVIEKVRVLPVTLVRIVV